MRLADFRMLVRNEGIWEPIPIYSEATQRWHMYYTGYTRTRACPYGEDGNGTIWHARSVVAGRSGIEGPYQDVNRSLTSVASFGGMIHGAEGGHLGDLATSSSAGCCCCYCTADGVCS